MFRNEVIKYKCKEKPEKEAIHSGHFMVSHFEAEEQDDEDELAVPVPETDVKQELEIVPIKHTRNNQLVKYEGRRQQLGGIDTSLSKLFQCMSLAYRQKLTSPKWNRFRGIRLRWKDKIRLNNVIWRCWHMQFIKKQNTLICQFASPLDVDTHNKPEAVVLEGKYWKRKLAAVTAEYKKWRMFYRNQISGQKESMDMLTEMELMAWNGQPTDDSMHMMVDEDYMGLMSDTLFSTITNQPFAFPDSREIAKAGLADFIQPSLGPLQPSLDDYMDTFELQDLISGKLPTVPEEQNWCYSDLDPMTTTTNLQALPAPNQVINNYNSLQSMQAPISKETTMATESRHMFAAPTGNIYAEGSEPIYMPSAALKDHKPDLLPMHVLQTSYTNYSVNETGTTLTTENSRNLNTSYKVNQDLGYKFTTPATPNYKFTSQATNAAVPTSSYNYKDDRPAQQSKVKTSVGRGRPRSRSNTREPIKKPPLISVCSEPSLINSSNSALLTQLLINNDTATYAGSSNQRKSRDVHSSSSLRVKEENMSLPILPQPQPTTLIITTPLKVTPLHTGGLNINDPLMLNTMSASNSPIVDSNSGQCLNSPTSSQGSIGSPTRENRDHRRAGHIHAEQKRRYNIKNGFDMIHSLIPQLNQNPNAKLSKAAMLQKAAEYIVHLKSERSLLKEEMDGLRQQIETLNTSISNCQSLLPATGAPVSRRRDNKMQEMFEEYVRTRTLDDWKFWIFSLFIRPLLASFNNFVSTTGMEDLYRSTLLWVEQHCTLGDLRPVVLSSLRYLCTKTDILAEPEKLPEEARQMVLTNQGNSSREHKPM